MGTYPLTPFLRGRGNADRFCEGVREEWAVFHGVSDPIQSHKTPLTPLKGGM